MNTKQKLTLGIAAIFMVTLTIVGVTYAYFVTRVNYSTTAVADIQTATIGSAFIAADTPTSFDHAFPGDKVYALFAVKNASLVDVPVFINLATSVKGTSDVGSTAVTALTANEFVHSSKTGDDLTNACYKSSAVPKMLDIYDGQGLTAQTYTEDCYDRDAVYDDNGTTKVPVYNNIVVRLYRVNTTGATAWGTGVTEPTHYAGTGEEFVDISVNTKDATGAPDATGLANIAMLTNARVSTRVTLNGSTMEENAPYAYLTKPDMTKAGNAITIADAEVVAAKAEAGSADVYNLYVLEAEYVNRQVNQNIENDAYVNLKVDIGTNELAYVSSDIQGGA